MKKINFVLLLFITFGSFLYASPNYKNGNGTILQESTIDNYRITIRKCEISTICGEFLNENMKVVYENYDYKDIVGKLIDNEKILYLVFAGRPVAESTCFHKTSLNFSF